LGSYQCSYLWKLYVDQFEIFLLAKSLMAEFWFYNEDDAEWKRVAGATLIN
jgi:hypothetical protein